MNILERDLLKQQKLNEIIELQSKIAQLNKELELKNEEISKVDNIFKDEFVNHVNTLFDNIYKTFGFDDEGLLELSNKLKDNYISKMLNYLQDVKSSNEGIELVTSHTDNTIVTEPNIEEPIVVEPIIDDIKHINDVITNNIENTISNNYTSLENTLEYSTVTNNSNGPNIVYPNVSNSNTLEIDNGNTILNNEQVEIIEETKPKNENRIPIFDENQEMVGMINSNMLVELKKIDPTLNSGGDTSENNTFLNETLISNNFDIDLNESNLLNDTNDVDDVHTKDIIENTKIDSTIKPSIESKSNIENVNSKGITTATPLNTHKSNLDINYDFINKKVDDITIKNIFNKYDSMFKSVSLDITAARLSKHSHSKHLLETDSELTNDLNTLYAYKPEYYDNIINKGVELQASFVTSLLYNIDLSKVYSTATNYLPNIKTWYNDNMKEYLTDVSKLSYIERILILHRTAIKLNATLDSELETYKMPIESILKDTPLEILDRLKEHIRYIPLILDVYSNVFESNDKVEGGTLLHINTNLIETMNLETDFLKKKIGLQVDDYSLPFDREFRSFEHHDVPYIHYVLFMLYINIK